MDISTGLAPLIHQSHLNLLVIIVSALFNFTGIYTFETGKLRRTLAPLKNWARTARRWLAMALLAVFLNSKISFSSDRSIIGPGCMPFRPFAGLVDISNTDSRLTL